MADRILLKGESREQVGTGRAVALRNQGKLPAVMYGHGEGASSFALSLHEFTEAIHHGQRLFDIEIDGKTDTLLVKDLQYDYLGKNFIHVDFIRVNLAELVTVNVVLNIKGTAAGTQEGGMLDIHLDAIEIECKVSEIPESIEVNVKEINVGDAIYAGDIELPAGATLKTDAEALILNCYVVAEVKTTEELEEEAPQAPEVITEKEEESEGE
ncbi:MAG: 50S ribosomal protein L25 [Phycisphaerae bacterium]|nr:50S ribosomal protein L25 [Phycisphaerae bacterium]